VSLANTGSDSGCLA